MAVKRKKISELTLSDNLKGLYTIGVRLIDGVQTSVKVSLEYIQAAYENVLNATRDAINATRDAITAASYANTATGNANDATGKANAAAENADKIRVATDKVREDTLVAKGATDKVRIATDKVREDTLVVKEATDKVRIATDKVREDMLVVKEGAEKATDDANNAAYRLNDLSDHRDEIREGYWWRWDETTEEWYNTGEIAKGNVMFAIFDIDPGTGILTMFTDPEYTGANFELSEDGILTVII